MSSSAIAEQRTKVFSLSSITRRPWLIITALWLVYAVIAVIVIRERISPLDFMDPDDALRLQQVRDWLGGQAWFDVSQHRINPPVGGPMHWSRLVDLPIAAAILLARPFVGQHLAEIVSCLAVPLLLLGAVCVALFHATQRLVGRGIALLAIVLLLITPTILIQFAPLRIDHHGWQILMATIAFAGALDKRALRGGLVAGLALAVWLPISTEGLPYAALFGGLFALRQWIDAREAPRLRGYAGALAGAGLLLVLTTRGLSAPFRTECDAFSAVYIWPIILFALCVVAGEHVPGGKGRTGRLLVPAIGALLAAVALLAISSPCLTEGPFHQLTPLAYQQWYLKVKEGRPIWEQARSSIGVSMLPSLLGIFATIWAIRVTDKEERTRWHCVLVMLLGAFAVSLLVWRGLSAAHVFALPAIAWLLARWITAIQKLPTPLLRVPLSVTLTLLTPVGLSSLWATLNELHSPPAKAEEAAKPPVNCRAAATLAALRPLPARSVLFAPLDIGPDILIHSPHQVVGTSHHRNVIGINAVTHAFTSSPDEARTDVMAINGGRGADYLVLCPTMNEIKQYISTNPRGLAAALSKGKSIGWLKPVPSSSPLKIYRVVHQSGVKANATPFMQ